MEAEVTEVPKNRLTALPGIKSLTSTSSDGSSNIKVEFEAGSDLETAANDIRDRVSRAQRNLFDTRGRSRGVQVRLVPTRFSL